MPGKRILQNLRLVLAWALLGVVFASGNAGDANKPAQDATQQYRPIDELFYWPLSAVLLLALVALRPIAMLFPTPSLCHFCRISFSCFPAA